MIELMIGMLLWFMQVNDVQVHVPPDVVGEAAYPESVETPDCLLLPIGVPIGAPFHGERAITGFQCQNVVPEGFEVVE